MKLRHQVFIFFIFFSVALYANESSIKITFGSCYKQDDSEAVFRNMRLQNSDAFFWLGDIIYADHFSAQKREAAYNQIKNKYEYKKLKSALTIDGTWDDHDYAHNNAGGDYLWKEQSKRALLNFLEIDRDSPVYTRRGIYHKRRLIKDSLTIETLFLDTRSFMKKSQRKLLGRAQWEWLEDNVRYSNADLIIIASSISVLSPVSRLLFWIEGWHQFEEEKQRLISLIKSTNKKIILLSGDRHYSDASRVSLNNGRFLYEFMSSGMTKTSRPMKSHLRINNPISEQNFSTLKIQPIQNNVLQILHEVHSSKTNRTLQRNIVLLR